MMNADATNEKYNYDGQNNSLWYPRVLVIGPGGIKGFHVLGFLSPLEDAGLLNYADTFCGVSVGSIISLLIVAGYQIREIVGEAATLDIFKDMESVTIQDIINQRGVFSNEPIRKRLSQLVLDKFGTIPTLYDLYMMTGKSFVAVTLNATDDTCELMSPFTHPDISCVDATMFSMNIPFLFYQIIRNGKIYVDGALGNPYPVDYFDDGKTNILGIYMKTKALGSNFPSVDKPTKDIYSEYQTHQEKVSFWVYTCKITNSMIDQRRNAIIKLCSNKCKHVCLTSIYNDTIGFTSTLKDKADMLVEGFNDGKKFLFNLNANPDNIRPKNFKYDYPEYYMKPSFSNHNNPDSTNDNNPDSTNDNNPDSTNDNNPDSTNGSDPDSINNNNSDSINNNNPDSINNNNFDSTNNNNPDSINNNNPDSINNNSNYNKNNLINNNCNYNDNYYSISNHYKIDDNNYLYDNYNSINNNIIYNKCDLMNNHNYNNDHYEDNNSINHNDHDLKNNHHNLINYSYSSNQNDYNDSYRYNW
jgi:predicted acylesterase/phospholipase RssA